MVGLSFNLSKWGGLVKDLREEENAVEDDTRWRFEGQVSGVLLKEKEIELTGT